MTNDTLTNEEIAALATAGWRIGGGGITRDGVVTVRGTRRDGNGVSIILRTRAEWREEINRVSLPTEPVAAPTPAEETQRESARVWNSALNACRAALVAAEAQVEAQRAALQERDALLVQIEALARAAGCQAVVEAIVRRGEGK